MFKNTIFITNIFSKSNILYLSIFSNRTILYHLRMQKLFFIACLFLASLVMSSMSTQYTAGSQGSEVAGKSHEWKTPVSASSRAKRWSRRSSGPRWRLTSSFQDSPVDQDDMDYYGMVLANLINGKAYTNEKRSCIRRGGPCDHRPNDCCPKSCKCSFQTNFNLLHSVHFIKQMFFKPTIFILHYSCYFLFCNCWFSKSCECENLVVFHSDTGNNLDKI